MRGTRAFKHAGAAWVAAVAGAWLVAANCRTVREPQPSVELDAVLLPESIAGERPIRVGIRVGVDQTSISAAGGVRVRGAAVGEDVVLVRYLPRATFEPTGEADRLRLLETGDELERAVVRPAQPRARLNVDSAPYRGVVEVLPADGGRVGVVNVVALEEYLRGVVPNELAPEAYPQIEALKAQAVAARSYALAHLGDYSSRGYDVCATAACQVYRGAASEHPLTDRAVSETAGVVASWRGRPINAFYTSTCGGHTEEGGAVFGNAAPYLRGVACPTERALAGTARPGAEWQVSLEPAAVARAVGRYGSVGRVLDLVPTEVGVSGRVVALRVVGSEGELELQGQKVRLGLGLRESLFVLHRETDASGAVERFVITGKGWGHGVGLCQVGASGMARAGASFEEILTHYYTGVRVASLDAPVAGSAIGAP